MVDGFHASHLAVLPALNVLSRASYKAGPEVLDSGDASCLRMGFLHANLVNQWDVCRLCSAGMREFDLNHAIPASGCAP
jgi:hypothetical protein